MAKLFEKPVKPDWEALLANLRRAGTPRRVHHLELFHDREIADAILAQYGLARDVRPDDPRAGVKRLMALHRFLGFDYVRVEADGFSGFPRPQLRSVDTTQAQAQKRPERHWTDEQGGPISDWESFEKYPWPDVAKCGADSIAWAVKNVPDDMCLVAGCHSVFEQVTWLTGYQALCYLLHDEPDLVDALFDRIGGIYLRLAEIYVQVPRIKFLLGGDDMGFKTATMVGPEVLRKAFRWHKRITELAHAHGKLNIFHCCGNRREIMEDIIAYCGFDGVHSFEDAIEPVTEAKRTYGRRIALLGGIDVDFLARADEAAIREKTRRTLEVCQPGGGYCLGTGNSVANYIPLGNYLAMVDEGRRY